MNDRDRRIQRREEERRQRSVHAGRIALGDAHATDFYHSTVEQRLAHKELYQQQLDDARKQQNSNLFVHPTEYGSKSLPVYNEWEREQKKYVDVANTNVRNGAFPYSDVDKKKEISMNYVGALSNPKWNPINNNIQPGFAYQYPGNVKNGESNTYQSNQLSSVSNTRTMNPETKQHLTQREKQANYARELQQQIAEKQKIDLLLSHNDNKITINRNRTGTQRGIIHNYQQPLPTQEFSQDYQKHETQRIEENYNPLELQADYSSPHRLRRVNMPTIVEDSKYSSYQQEMGNMNGGLQLGLIQSVGQQIISPSDYHASQRPNPSFSQKPLDTNPYSTVGVIANPRNNSLPPPSYATTGPSYATTGPSNATIGPSYATTGLSNATGSKITRNEENRMERRKKQQEYAKALAAQLEHSNSLKLQATNKKDQEVSWAPWNNGSQAHSRRGRQQQPFNVHPNSNDELLHLGSPLSPQNGTQNVHSLSSNQASHHHEVSYGRSNLTPPFIMYGGETLSNGISQPNNTPASNNTPAAPFSSSSLLVSSNGNKSPMPMQHHSFNYSDQNDTDIKPIYHFSEFRDDVQDNIPKVSNFTIPASNQDINKYVKPNNIENPIAASVGGTNRRIRSDLHVGVSENTLQKRKTQNDLQQYLQQQIEENRRKKTEEQRIRKEEEYQEMKKIEREQELFKKQQQEEILKKKALIIEENNNQQLETNLFDKKNKSIAMDHIEKRKSFLQESIHKESEPFIERDASLVNEKQDYLYGANNENHPIPNRVPREGSQYSRDVQQSNEYRTSNHNFQEKQQPPIPSNNPHYSSLTNNPSQTLLPPFQEKDNEAYIHSNQLNSLPNNVTVYRENVRSQLPPWMNKNQPEHQELLESSSSQVTNHNQGIQNNKSIQNNQSIQNFPNSSFPFTLDHHHSKQSIKQKDYFLKRENSNPLLFGPSYPPQPSTFTKGYDHASFRKNEEPSFHPSSNNNIIPLKMHSSFQCSPSVSSEIHQGWKDSILQQKQIVEELKQNTLHAVALQQCTAMELEQLKQEVQRHFASNQQLHRIETKENIQLPINMIQQRPSVCRQSALGSNKSLSSFAINETILESESKLIFSDGTACTLETQMTSIPSSTSLKLEQMEMQASNVLQSLDTSTQYLSENHWQNNNRKSQGKSSRNLEQNSNRKGQSRISQDQRNQNMELSCSRASHDDHEIKATNNILKNVISYEMKGVASSELLSRSEIVIQKGSNRIPLEKEKLRGNNIHLVDREDSLSAIINKIQNEKKPHRYGNFEQDEPLELGNMNDDSDNQLIQSVDIEHISQKNKSRLELLEKFASHKDPKKDQLDEFLEDFKQLNQISTVDVSLVTKSRWYPANLNF